MVVQEWLAEAFTMRGLPAVVTAVTAAGGDARPGVWVYRMDARLLVALGALTALTGAVAGRAETRPITDSRRIPACSLKDGPISGVREVPVMGHRSRQYRAFGPARRRCGQR